MPAWPSRLRQRISDRLGDNRDWLRGIQESLTRIEDQQHEIRAIVDTLSAPLDRLDRRMMARVLELRDSRDDIASNVLRLEQARQSAEYEATLSETEPLISVRIPAFKKTEQLLDVAVASVLKQTYDRFEVVIVNDGPNPATRDAVAKLGDDRIRYVEFPEQNHYPSDPHLRWMVAGAPGMNRGAELARGRWIAPLDDDDEFTPDHLEKLLKLALSEQAELAYGAIVQKNLTRNTEAIIWSDPPEISNFTFMGGIYMKVLGFFEYDLKSWIVDEPADWNLIRRMSASGVRMASTRDVVGTMYSVSYTQK